MYVRSFSLTAAVAIATLASSASALVASPKSKTAGAAACSDLQTQLGNKVAPQGISPSYVGSTTYYYSQEQVQNKPACVVAPTAYTDVQTAMKVIRAHNATMAVKAGGHNTNNYWSSVSGGVLIDFKDMTAKSYDASSNTGYYQPGNRWGDLYKYYQQFDRTVVGGRISGIGSGLALGGGLSFLSGEYGLACDGFQKLDVVLADGSLVQATKDNEYSDLLFSLKGGGNQFGTVVGYTVDVHPISDFWGGIMIFGADQIEAVLEEVLNFTNTNTDPKAAVIGTLSVLGTPSLLQDIGINIPGLDTLVILFNVYDGPDGAKAFQRFTDIPHLIDTRKKQTYVEIADMVELGHLSSGAVSYRAGSHNSTSPTALATFKQAVANFRQYARDVKGTYDILSFDVQPVVASLVEASRARGGNAHDSPDGPYYWINYLFSYIPGTPGVSSALAKMKTLAEKTPNDAGIPIFLNDANSDQPILQSYGAYDKLKAAKAKYDPDNYLATHMGGPSFT